MDFGLSGPEQAFADEVRAFLHAHPPETFPEDGTDAGYGSGAHSRAFTARARASAAGSAWAGRASTAARRGRWATS